MKLKLTAIGVLLLAITSAWFYWKHNVEWAARVAWGEARGEPDDGMHAVLNVMMNRKRDPRFPNSLSGVALQPYQFTAYNRDDPNRQKLDAVAEDDPSFQRAKWLATFAQMGLLWDITDGATYYHSIGIERPDFLSDAEVSAIIGNHIFYVAD
ncbi:MULTISPECIES: cell wall hydrolase [Kordiimonas]|jgi:spore germination cell wall hydrolase CwlJ-like protein|uniref:cell wall hydrolase n=1 Tax=Kordiimonas TaxID=288021 RepID=UPI0025806F38|nr:cell wall hydrolase [Kordiimonas sp. UBA4487]